MSKKPTRIVQPKRAVKTPSFMSGFLKKAGVDVKNTQPQQATQNIAQATQKLTAEIAQIEKARGAQDALTASEKALAQYPQSVALLNCTAILLMKNNRFQEAVTTFERIPDYDKNVGVLTNLGVTYRQMQQYKKAAEIFHKVLAIDPNRASTLQNMGLVQTDLGNYSDAVKYYRQILDKDPENAEISYNLGTTYGRLQDLPASNACYRKTLELNPTHLSALGNWALIQNYMVPYDAKRITRETIAYAEKAVKGRNIRLPAVKAENPKKKLHIGLVTADMKDVHPVGYFLEGLLSDESAKQFDWSAYMNGVYDDRLTQKVRPLFKHWHNIGVWTDARAIEQIRSDGVDILIDLSGYTGKNRAGIFMAQTAPVQVEWLGWFATTGLPHMNAMIADPYCVPESEEHLYSEKIYRMPHTRLCMQPPYQQVKIDTLPALKNGYMTFGCYQNPLKISEDTLQTWAKIAQALPDARWYFKSTLNAPGKPAQIKFQEKLVALGFNLDNLTFTDSEAREKYFQSHNGIDLILDTFPYPGGTTTVDALWMGVPTLTLALPGMIARQGEQLMSAAGYPQFVCQTHKEYVEKALYWSNPANREQLAALKVGMREQVLSSPVFDTVKFSEDWCNLIRRIWQDACKKAAQEK
ncbi:putative O-linked N-acetylglucosamine transferase (SPINDLY family) [Cricetibacter osteomyelitidis]|uniref:protein O-GlcNAc transferase n=1 Tax=Cricetibacter osteomyelitidis TaxID=1521931 RepID=A0A4R2T1S4_9PAST|nr:tetratricopeptide repeat protein [Cricetibacter osteomyelitidis]TCP96857.1 putative O-linked N-acetylglucosamine transferase (SPINDLY family) [Cricetibacter osteomyelitidis]